MRRTLKSKFLLSTIMGGVVASTAMTAMAQDDINDEVIVTGSRLNVNPNLTSANPVLTVDDAEIASRGTVNIEDLTNNLPQVFAGQAAEVSNGASGTSTLNLRGLGATRTLTMIDGRRLPYGSSTFSPANLDLVPTALIERVDILTGGASAVYGSDAIGGVANFILKRDFEGAELDLQYGFAQNGNGIDRFDEVSRAAGVDVPGSVTDGEEFNASFALGANTADGKGNVTVFGSYQNREAITQDNRSFSACTLGNGNTNGFGCVGSGNFRLFAGPGGAFFQQEDGTIVPYAGGSAQTFNFGPFNFFQRPAERFQIYGKGQYEIAEGHEVFASASFTSNFSDAQVAPSASFGSYSINCDNPLIQGNDLAGGGSLASDVFGCSTADIAAGTDVSGMAMSHRNVEGGPRNSRLENSAYRLVGGLRGELGNWNYETFAQYSRTTDQSVSTNDFVIANLQDAIFAVDDGMGNVVCRSGNAGCVPYNIFQRGAGGESLVTPAQTDYIQGVGITQGETEQLVYGANFQTNLGDYGFKSPFSDSGVGLLLGTEYREDKLESIPDEISQVPGGGFTGVGGATLPVKGSVEVFELFTEMQIPLVTDMPFAEELVLSGQYRYSDYDTNGNGTSGSFNTDAYGVQLTWQPVEDVNFRGQFQRSVRAPNVIELYTGQDTGLPNLNAGVNSAGNTIYDPCATANPTASAAACANTGVTAAQYGTILDVISGQTQAITGGNPNLNPETSDTFTVGAVFSPSALPGFTASVDYFDISVEDFISAGIGVQTTLDQCLATGDAAFCSLITRDGRGSLVSGSAGVGFAATNINIATLDTSGFDFQAGYNLDLEDLGVNNMGDVRLQYAGTILDKFDFTPFPGGTVIECAGKYGNDCAQPVNPTYRHRMLATWNTPFGIETTLTWRHLSGTDNISAAPSPVDERLAAADYFDLSGNYEITEGVRFRAGMNNIFSEQPPVSISSGPPLGNGNTYPVSFDTGRFIFFGLNIKM